MPSEVAHDLPARLKKAASEARDAVKAAELRLEHRDELVVEAIDEEGMSQQEVARLIGVAKGRIHAILLKQHAAGDE